MESVMPGCPDELVTFLGLYARALFCRQGGPGGLSVPPLHQGFTSPAWAASLAAPALSQLQGCSAVSGKPGHEE